MSGFFATFIMYENPLDDVSGFNYMLVAFRASGCNVFSEEHCSLYTSAVGVSP